MNHIHDFSLPTKNLAGTSLVYASPDAAAGELCRLAKSATKGSRRLSFHLVNAYTLALAYQDKAYARLLRNAKANFPDGKPLTWWRLEGGARLQQIRGPQLFDDVMSMGRATNVRHFLLGSSEETLALLTSNLRRRHPGVNIVGTYSPPYRKMTDAEIQLQDDQIVNSGAEIVWVGLGTPKQDWEVERLAEHLGVVAVAVGAAFDFSAGTKRPAPEWMSKLGLEWLFRLMSEPRRLWKRYLIGNTVFVWSIIRHHLNQGLLRERRKSR